VFFLIRNRKNVKEAEKHADEDKRARKLAEEKFADNLAYGWKN
jgi:hypothetical protein